MSLALVKLGNPVVLGHMVAAPGDLQEWLSFAWPPHYGYVLLGVVVLGAGSFWRPLSLQPWWLLALAVLWLAWQEIATRNSSEGYRNPPVMWHYVSLVACLGCGTILARMKPSAVRWFWLALSAGFLWVLFEGFRQHYGGLEATRNFVYQQPDWESYPPEFLKRLARDRVFSTLFYANALAGVVVMLLPPLAWVCWHAWPERLRLARSVSTGLLVYAGLACLLWSGSKAGWLIAVSVVTVAALHLPGSPFARRDELSQSMNDQPGRSRSPSPQGERRGDSSVPVSTSNRRGSGRLRVALILAGIVVALVGFAVRFQDYFRRGAPSVVARFDYWAVAGSIVIEHPMLGTGPGSFEELYSQRRKPDAEMTRLVHNDYLQQASDSGIPGALLFAGLVWGALASGYRSRRSGGLPWMVWLGLLGWALQEAVEFGLFIPAVSWPAMVLLGWLAAETYSDRQRSGASLASDHP
jgi:O-antigen ligase